MKNWLTHLFGRSGAPARATARTRLGLERLPDRAVPSFWAADFASGVSGDLDPTGWQHLTQTDTAILQVDDTDNPVSESPLPSVSLNGTDNPGCPFGWQGSSPLDAAQLDGLFGELIVTAVVPAPGQPPLFPVWRWLAVVAHDRCLAPVISSQIV